jgi:serine/threonine-protein kinase
MLAAGSRVGPYEIVAQIGVGGMGEVYRAIDTGLHRDVAIKVLPEAVARDAEMLARFEREARTLASLSHPGIAVIHGLEQTGGTRALVMEFIEGPTLADRIGEGAVAIDEALTIVRQIADALEAAHDQGIVHRDLKPANVKVRPDGTVKVLDFGLAKTLQPAAAVGSTSPTITSPVMTLAGTILGTPAYMSPEQAKGRSADKRSDVWALGCVAYELLTARRAFDGEHTTEVLASILRGEPDWNALPRDLPPAVLALLKRMLEKDRRRRVADVAAVLFVLSEPQLTGSHPAASRRATPMWMAAAGLGVMTIAGVAWWGGGRSRAVEPRPVTRLTIPLIGGQQALSAASTALAISPDGKYVALNANGRLYLRALDRLDVVAVPGTESNITASGVTRRPTFSPDSKWLGFWKDGEIRKVAVAGGPPVTITSVPRVTNLAWEPDGFIVFLTPDGLFRVPEAGGPVVPLVESVQGRVQSFQMLSGNRVLLTRFPAGTIDAAQAEIVVRSVADRRENVVMKGGVEARYVPTGHLLYFSGGSLLTIRFDLDTLALSGVPEPVADRVVSGSAPGFPVASAHVAVSAVGTLAYIRGDDRRSSLRTLTWVDRSGREEPLGFRDEPYVYPRLSPHDRFIGVTMRREVRSDIWLLDIGRTTARPLTTDPTDERYSIWTPDEERVAFGSVRGDDAATWWLPVDGSRAPVRVAGVPFSRFTNFIPTTMTPQGDQLVVTAGGPNATDLWLVPLNGGEPRPLLQTPAIERNAEISPNGKWLAYELFENGEANVIVRPFPNVNDGYWRVSTGGGSQPLCSRDGT